MTQRPTWDDVPASTSLVGPPPSPATLRRSSTNDPQRATAATEGGAIHRRPSAALSTSLSPHVFRILNQCRGVRRTRGPTRRRTQIAEAQHQWLAILAFVDRAGCQGCRTSRRRWHYRDVRAGVFIS